MTACPPSLMACRNLGTEDVAASALLLPKDRTVCSRVAFKVARKENEWSREGSRTTERIDSHFRYRHCRSHACVLARPSWIQANARRNCSAFAHGGYVIDFWGRGFDVAEKMGILPAIKREGYDVKELRIVAANGRRIGGFDADVFRSATLGRYVSIPRGELAKIVYQKIESSCETIFGDSVTKIGQSANHVRVSFHRMAPRDFDIVVGADGLHSVVRKLIFGEEDRFEKYLGYYVAAFAVNGYRPRDEDVYVTYSVPGKQVARFAMRDDRTMFLFVFSDNEGRRINSQDTNAHKDALRSEFEQAGWECPQILAAMESCNDVYFDRVSQIQMDKWSQERVGLIGDAAFCPSLLAGQGAALAMVAAYVLAGELGKTAGLPQEAFER
jgi:2-polyprenyl-6-methoxyphenol hydroxylase-like FAD-dependent oxidoreductase